jgi:hypothetical protein
MWNFVPPFIALSMSKAPVSKNCPAALLLLQKRQSVFS